MDCRERSFILVPFCSHVIWHVKILIHLVYYCPSHLTEVRIKYRPTLPSGRQVQPSLTNEISAFMVHVKQTAPKVSEATLLDLSGSRSACCQRSLMPPKANGIEVKLRDSSLPNIDPKCGTLFISPELLPLGYSWGEAHYCDPQSFFLGGAILFWRTFL